MVTGIVLKPETVAWARRAVGEGDLRRALVPNAPSMTDAGLTPPRSELIIGRPLDRRG